MKVNREVRTLIRVHLPVSALLSILRAEGYSIPLGNTITLHGSGGEALTVTDNLCITTECYETAELPCVRCVHNTVIDGGVGHIH